MNIKIGTVLGTGAAINVSLGFAPSSVEIINDTAGDSLQWMSSMGAGHAYKRIATGVGSKITSGGISAYAGDESNGKGFTIGVDGVNASGVALRYIAIGER